MAKTTAKSGRSQSKPRSGMSKGGNDAISILKQDHERVKQILARLESSTARGASARQRMIADLDRELKIHTKIEEEIVYPAYERVAKKRDERALFFEAKEEHRIVDEVMPSLMDADPSSEEFAGKVHALKEIVEHHIKEEERDMFPVLKRVLEREELEALGGEIIERRDELTSMENIDRDAIVDEPLASARVEGSSARRMDLGAAPDEPADTTNPEDDEPRPI